MLAGAWVLRTPFPPSRGVHFPLSVEVVDLVAFSDGDEDSEVFLIGLVAGDAFSSVELTSRKW